MEDRKFYPPGWVERRGLTVASVRPTEAAKAGIGRVLDEMEKWADDEEAHGLYDCRNLGTDAVRGWATVMRGHLAGLAGGAR